MERLTSRTRLAGAATTVFAIVLGTMQPGGAAAQALAVPPFDQGQVLFRGAEPKMLHAADLNGIRAWLDTHRTGWRANMATSPVAEVEVSLGTSVKPAAITLDLWPTAADADWRGSVVVEDAAGHATWIQTLPAADAASLLHLLR